MIDTDKYEGHTPAPWMMGEYKGRPSIYAGDETFVRSIARGLNPSQTADHNLIADAPKLLAEVKRLRKQYTELREALVGDSPNWTQEELIEKVLEIYDKALVFDIIYDFNERMQLQSESYENELWRMDWLLKNPTKEYEDYDKEMNKND